jgi:hypothetical protein
MLEMMALVGSPEAATIYLADHVDPTRLPTNDTAG